MQPEHRHNTHTQTHQRRHTQEIENNLCPTQIEKRISNRVRNTSTQMSSTENPAKENRGLTLIPCSVWRASSSDVRYRDVLHAAAVEVSVQRMSLQLTLHHQQISWDTHSLKPNKVCTKPSRTARGAATRGAPKPPSCDHEQPALCRCPATAPGRAAPMATNPTKGTSRSSRKSTMASSMHLPPHPHPHQHCCFSGELSSVGVGVSSVLVSVALLSVGTATAPILTTRPSPPNRTSSVRGCESPSSASNRP